MTVRYVIAFEPVRSGRFRSPPICRLKGLLKTSLRGWGLRAVAVREETPGMADLGAGLPQDELEAVGGR